MKLTKPFASIESVSWTISFDKRCWLEEYIQVTTDQLTGVNSAIASLAELDEVPLALALLGQRLAFDLESAIKQLKGDKE